MSQHVIRVDLFPSLTNANCRDTNPEDFFPGSSGRPAEADISFAKQICNGCPERTPCLEWAIANKEQGIWGGTTDEERRGKRMGRDDRRAAVMQLHGEGCHDVEIARRLKVSRSVVHHDRSVLGLAENFNRDLGERRAAVAHLHALGLNDREIAEKLSVSRDIARHDRAVLGLRPNFRPGSAA